MLFDLGEILNAEQAREWMQRIDPDHDGSIERSEFVDAILNYVYERTMLDVQAEVGPGNAQVALVRGGVTTSRRRVVVSAGLLLKLG